MSGRIEVPIVIKWLLPPLALASSSAIAWQSKTPVCVSRREVEGPEAQDDETALFRGHTNNDQSWAGHFKGGRCPSMNPLSVVQVDRFGNRYCEGDVVRAISPPSRMRGPACTIDTLVPVPPHTAPTP